MLLSSKYSHEALIKSLVDRSKLRSVYDTTGPSTTSISIQLHTDRHKVTYSETESGVLSFKIKILDMSLFLPNSRCSFYPISLCYSFYLFLPFKFP